MRFVPRFWKDKRGVSAVEFALIAPLLVTAYFGLAEMSQAFLADGKAGRVASAIGDLAAQDTLITNAEMTDIFKIGGVLVQPFPASSLKMRITSLTSTGNASGTPSTMPVKVDWSDGQGLAALTGTTRIPAGLISNGQTIILAETEFTYTSPVAKLASGPVTFDRSFYLRPRRSDTITRSP